MGVDTGALKIGTGEIWRGKRRGRWILGRYAEFLLVRRNVVLVRDRVCIATRSVATPTFQLSPWFETSPLLKSLSGALRYSLYRQSRTEGSSEGNQTLPLATLKCAASKMRSETQADGVDILLAAESPVLARRTGRLTGSPASGRYKLQVSRTSWRTRRWV